jgi:hypothetical protein
MNATNDAIAILEQTVKDLSAQLEEAECSLKDAKLAACDIKIGDIVMYHEDEYLVSRVYVGWTDWKKKPWLLGYKRRKNGTFGKRPRNLYGNWERKAGGN